MSILEEAYNESQELSACIEVALKACRAFRGDTSFLDVAVITSNGVRMGNRIPATEIISFSKSSISR